MAYSYNMTSRSIFGLLPLLHACGGPPQSPGTTPPAPADTTQAAYIASSSAPQALGSVPSPAETLSNIRQPTESPFLAAEPAEPLPHTRWNRSWFFEQRGDLGSAVEQLERLQELDPSYPGLERRLSLVRMRRDRLAALVGLRTDSLLPVEEEPRPGSGISIAAVGDIQLGMGWPEDNSVLPPDQASGMFTHVSDWLGGSDISFGNLETVLADSGESTKCRRGSRNCYAFRAPTAYAKTLRNVGFDVMSINNNHAADFGDAGMRTTRAALEKAGIIHSGPSGIATWQTQSLRIALIAFSTGDSRYRVQDVESARGAVAAASRDHDLVLVSFHGGAEGSGATHVPKTVETAFGENRGNVFAFSHALVDAGADLVLGHGPHVLRGMEIYRGRLIAYSLGNFAAWHGFNLRGPLGISAVLNVTLAPNGVITKAEIKPVYLERPGIPSSDPERRAVAIIRDLSLEDFGHTVFDEAGRFELESGDRRMENGNFPSRSPSQAPISNPNFPISNY